MMQLNYFVNGGDFTNAGNASSNVKKTLKKLNVDPKIIRRVVVALYEAEVNIVAHAYNGNIDVFIDTEKIKIILKDKGPGIKSIDNAMKVGFTTASAKVREMGFGAGMGLPNINKNADELKIKSEVGEGTELTITTYLEEKK